MHDTSEIRKQICSLCSVSQFTSWSQRPQPGKVTLQFVSSFKAFTGLKTMGLASGKKKSPGTISLPAESWKMAL